MPFIETTFEVRKQKLKLKDVILSLFNYYSHYNISLSHKDSSSSILSSFQSM